MLKSVLFFKKALSFARKGPFFNVIVQGGYSNIVLITDLRLKWPLLIAGPRSYILSFLLLLIQDGSCQLLLHCCCIVVLRPSKHLRSCWDGQLT